MRSRAVSLPFAVLGLDALLAAAEMGLVAPRLQPVEDVFHNACPVPPVFRI